MSDLKFGTNGLIPVIVQEVDGTVLMFAYMNREALQRTVDTGEAWFWSRSRQELWNKGAASGHKQLVQSIVTDCDGDALLLTVEQQGPGACHEGYRSCFHYELSKDGQRVTIGEPSFDPDQVYGAKGQDVFEELYGIIADRRDMPVEGSYTAYLFQEGLDKILKKVGEESAEVIIAAKNDTRQPLLEETADLIYHLTVLMAERGLTPKQVFRVLHERRSKADTQSGRPENGLRAAADGSGSTSEGPSESGTDGSTDLAADVAAREKQSDGAADIGTKPGAKTRSRSDAKRDEDQ